MESKLCRKCFTVKLLVDFVKSADSKSGYRHLCKECNNAYYAQRRIDKYEKVRSYERKFHRTRNLKYNFGINEEIYDKMLLEQNNTCALCPATKSDSTRPNLAVDHCHTTGRVRGLLCGKCNKGLGLFSDNVELLKRAINYLEKYK